MKTAIFKNRTLFLTGASGFLGTALVCKIVLSTSCQRIVLLCRGGLNRLHQVWQDTLPPHTFDRLRDDRRIEIVEGDICEKDLGLDAATIAQLQATVNIVIHAASSINLRHNLARIAPTIIQGTLNVANFALDCDALERFVYISSTYTNAHLHHLNPKEICHVSEQIYPLTGQDAPVRDAEAEWLDLQKYGTTAEFECNSFFWSYAYAKHLTERLLSNIFQEGSSSSNSIASSFDDSIDFNGKQKLLIVRPSIIGPAEMCPYPGWQVATSAPVTGLLAFLILSPAKKLHFYSQFDNPNHDAMIDEIPVDIVANRVIMHAFIGTSGVVHANRDLPDCYSFGNYVRAIQPLRRLPWKSNVVWQNDWKSKKLCQVAQLYQVGGCTFDFDSQKTSNLWSVMSLEDRETFQLSAAMGYGTGSTIDMSSRDDAFRRLFAMYFKRRKWPEWMLPLLYIRG